MQRGNSFFSFSPPHIYIYLILFIRTSSTIKTPWMEYSEKLNTDVRKDVGIESNSTLYATRRVCHIYIYIYIYICVCHIYSSNCKLLCSVSFLSVLTYSFCKTGADRHYNYCSYADLKQIITAYFQFPTLSLLSRRGSSEVINLHRSVYCITNI